MFQVLKLLMVIKPLFTKPIIYPRTMEEQRWKISTL